MNLPTILTQYDSGELSKNEDVALLDAQIKVDAAASYMRDFELPTLRAAIVSAETPIMSMIVRLDELETISLKISAWLDTRYGCND